MFIDQEAKTSWPALIVVFIIALAIGGGIYYWQSQQEMPDLAETTPTPTPTASSTPTDETEKEIKGQEISYKDQEHEFSLVIPEDISYKKSKEEGAPIFRFYGDPEKYAHFFPPEKVDYGQQETITLEAQTYDKKNWEENIKGTTPIKINGKSGLQMIHTRGADEYTTKNCKKTVLIFIKTDRNIYSFFTCDYTLNRELLNEIFSSFEVTK
ncbi:MAG: hypothetical protein PHI88_01990 [Candidatus Pacebacteria bacterium]|jgi:hypothetical protein|nr:hypothetical protein [Candidatus Paceibacterota bacterium]